MKHPRPPAPICPPSLRLPIIKEVEEYRLYALQSLEAYYRKVINEISVSSPENLAELEKILNEYKTIESNIAAKLASIEEMVNSFIQTHGGNPTHGAIKIKYDYDPVTKNLSYSLISE